MYYYIKEMSQCDIIDLNLKTLSWLKYKVVKNAKYKPIVNKLKDIVGFENTNKNDNHFWMLAIMLVKSKKSGKDGCWFPRKNEKYAEINSEYNPKFKINRRWLCNLVDTLESQGMLHMYSGFKNFTNEELSITSRVVFSEYLLSLVTDSLLCKEKDPYDEYPELQVNIKEKREDGKTRKVQLKNIGNMKNASIKKKNVYAFNKFLEQQEVELDGKLYKLKFKRVFRDNLEGCGRWYECGSFQVAKKEKRKLIKINGNNVTEVDISSIHPCIIAAKNGIDLTGKDPYGLYDPDLVEIFKGVTNLRIVCKIAVMCMINCKTRSGAAKATLNYMKEEDCNYPEDLKIYEKLIKGLELHNKGLPFFDENTIDYKQLQYIDSEICEKVLLTCKAMGFLALPYHDSWVVESHRQQELIEIIKKSWFAVLGSMMNFRYKVEF